MSSTSNPNTVIDELYADELGTLVFQTALLQYLAELPESEAAGFEAYLSAHIDQENFLTELCALYPDFEHILKSEMSVIQHELATLTETAADSKSS